MIRLFLKFSFGTWVSAALSILTLPIITALIRPDQFGRAAMFSLAVGLVHQLVTLGADQAYAREYYSRSPGEDRAALLRDALALPLGLSVAAAMAIVVLAEPVTRLLFGEPDRFAALLLAATVVMMLAERFAMLTLRMEQRAVAFSFLRILFALTTFLVTLGYALLVDTSFHAIAAAQLAGLVLVSVIAIGAARKSWRPGAVSPAGIRSALAYGLPFIPAFAAMWVVEATDKIALRYFTDFTELGIFSAAYRFIALVTLVQAGFSTFWVPVSFDLYERDPSLARATFSRSLNVMTALLFAAGFAVLLAKELIALLFAADYRDAAWVMPFLLFVPLMYALSEISSGGINLARRPRWHSVIAVVTAAANVALNLLLVPGLGALGAAVATGCSYMLFFALRTHISQRLFPIDLGAGRLLPILAAFSACCAAHSLAPDAPATYAATVAALALCAWLYKAELRDAADQFGRAAVRREVDSTERS